MKTINAPFISRVQINNFRNFGHVDVNLSHKQIIIGENNVGKTNLLRALQLILDPKLSDDDRFLTESDFYEDIQSPMENGEEVKISIDIQGYAHNKILLSTLCDATVSDSPPTIRLTYHFYATQNSVGSYDYQYRIYQGDKEDIPFTNYHRKYLNLKVIPAIRDVEAEMRNLRKSPINQLLKSYDIRKEELDEIAKRLKETSDEVLSIDELMHLTDSINSRFVKIIGQQIDSSISLDTMDLDPNRILNTLKILIGQGRRQVSDTSLGLNNILYISLVLLSLEDKTIPAILKVDSYSKLLEVENSEVINQCYTLSANGNYTLLKDITPEKQNVLYTFMDTNYGDNKGFTILAIEEPEAHLHPALQRLIFKDVMQQNTSVIMTTHSPHITSVAPINSIVHLRAMSSGTAVKTTASLQLNDRDFKDLTRYIDVKKGEIYFGKGVILVEGVAEEYLIPSFAKILQMPLDQKGIICCNINSTNFKPYVQFLDALGIPYVAITDGDYYYRESVSSDKKFGQIFEEHHEFPGYDGLDRTCRILVELGKVEHSEIPSDFNEADEFYRQYNFYIGNHTLELDMMDISHDKDACEVFIQVFNDLTSGGDKQKENFKVAIEATKYVDCLNKIESKHSRMGKGRYAQGLSTECAKENIPAYIEEALESIFNKVDDL